MVDPFTGGQVGQPGPLPYADITDPQTLNKYAYVRNNPLRYVDPDGHAIDTLLDIGFIAYDVYKIATEGATKTNVAALGADAAATLIPFASGAGAAVRLGAKAEHAIVEGEHAVQAVKAVERGRASEKAVLGAEGLAKNTAGYQSRRSEDWQGRDYHS
ncbi:MAG: hypothetical protein LC130_26235 [Bryobacterales bacterium]|nr:hypothetical protein [Bryobacterales bacterium]